MRAFEFLKEEAKAAKYNGLLMKYAFNDNALIIKAFTKEGPVAFVKFVKENKELYHRICGSMMNTAVAALQNQCMTI